MKLLILTQKVDINDSVLGFFHNWIEKLSFKYERIIVIALEVGEYNLPDNVGVFSLGKEKGHGKFQRILQFYKLVLQKRNEYNAIFVHMNVEYIVLVGLLWKILTKKIILWYNHPFGGFKASVAMLFCNKIFYTSFDSHFAKNRKAEIMPVGIDTNIFKNKDLELIKTSKILSLGRISPVKNIHLLIQAALLLDKENVDFTINIYGDAPNRDGKYYKTIKNDAKLLIQKKKIFFLPAVANYKTPEIYNQHGLFINLTPSGSFDKTILEAMACENLVCISNNSLGDDLPPEFLFKNGDVEDLKNKIKNMLALEDDKILEYIQHSYEQISHYIHFFFAILIYKTVKYVETYHALFLSPKKKPLHCLVNYILPLPMQ